MIACQRDDLAASVRQQGVGNRVEHGRRVIGVAALGLDKRRSWRPALACGLMFALLVLPGVVPAYETDIRQQLTFLAARQFNQCVAGTDIPQLTALQVRNIVRANVQESEAGWWQRATRWGFYDRRNQETDQVLLGRVDTRMHGRYNAAARRVTGNGEREDLDRFRDLGTVVHFLQSVTVPANVVPIFHPRPWRWNGTDRFSIHPLDRDALTRVLAGTCATLLATPESENLRTLLDRTAAVTIANVRAPIDDMDSTWQAFWEEEEPGSFGDYGPAGNNFGRAARFPCGDTSCELLDDDPIYLEFALQQHRLAALSTMRALLILQRFRLREGVVQPARF